MSEAKKHCNHSTPVNEWLSLEEYEEPRWIPDHFTYENLLVYDDIYGSTDEVYLVPTPFKDTLHYIDEFGDRYKPTHFMIICTP